MGDFQFPANAPSANPVFFRTYSRRWKDGRRESWAEVCDRTIKGLVELGKLTQEQADLIRSQQQELKSLPSGRWLWIGGTEWSKKPANFSGSYNCTSTNVEDWRSFGLMMDLAMQGSGTGAILEPKYIGKLPVIRNRINVTIQGEIGSTPAFARREDTKIDIDGNNVYIYIGDSRNGWVKSYQTLLELSSDDRFDDEVNVIIDPSSVRIKGEKLKGFGGVANPVKLTDLYGRCAAILNKAVGRQLTSVECCLLIDEAAVTIVAGNVRRSAGMRQGSSSDQAFATAKENLWRQDEEGDWRIDPERDSLRMANHTRVFHRKPALDECIEAVRKQFYSGEGAIQWAGEAITRSNRDILNTNERKKSFLDVYEDDKYAASHLLSEFALMDGVSISVTELSHRMGRYGLNPCGEIIGENFHCNLAEIHLNQLDPHDLDGQRKAFEAGGLSVAVLLHHKFTEPRYQRSRELDPIVGVSFTGLFDFFVHAFGADWLRWWEAGRSENWNDGSEGWQDRVSDIANIFPDWWGYSLKTSIGEMFADLESRYLSLWKEWAEQAVWAYCDEHGLKRPNRCTTVQPAGTKSLLTGASSGWHPPVAARFIRRITFRKNDPVALACLDYGYNVIPSQSDKDETGKLLDDPFDPRCTEWLVEIPTEVSWANLPGADTINISQFSALAQMDFYMNVQKFYTTHNTSATISLRENEIEALGTRIYEAIQNDEGYISAALLARFDDLETFPRLPFEPISKEEFDRLSAEVLQHRKTDDFYEALVKHDVGEKAVNAELAPAGCDSDKCLLPSTKG